MVKKKNENHFIKAAVTGAALIGAGALLAAAALSDEDTKKKFDKKAKEAGENLEKLIQELRVRGGDVYKEALEQFEVLKKKVETMVEEGKKTDEYKKVLVEIDKITDKLSEAKTSTGDELAGLMKDVKASVEDLKEEFDKLDDSVKA